jgi:hypothetical protein
MPKLGMNPRAGSEVIVDHNQTGLWGFKGYVVTINQVTAEGNYIIQHPDTGGRTLVGKKELIRVVKRV